MWIKVSPKTMKSLQTLGRRYELRIEIDTDDIDGGLIEVDDEVAEKLEKRAFVSGDAFEVVLEKLLDETLVN